MNTETEKDFEDYGCASRCIIYLVRELGATISVDDFVLRYDSLFKSDQGKKRAGLITRTGAKFICEDLGIASSTQCFIKFSDIPNIKVNGILVFTEKKPESDGTYSDYNHSGLIDPTSIGHDTLRYGQVDQNVQVVWGLLPESSFSLWIPEYTILIP